MFRVGFLDDQLILNCSPRINERYASRCSGSTSVYLANQREVTCSSSLQASWRELGSTKTVSRHLVRSTFTATIALYGGVFKRLLHLAIPVNTQYNFSFTFSTPWSTWTFIASNSFMYFAPQDSDCPLKPLNLTLPANLPFVPVPLSLLLLENPTARQVLQDIYDQLLDSELAILKPVVELLV
jgi:hypothetical protein